MHENSKYYHINESNDFFILDDRVELNFLEILIYPTGIFLFLFYATTFLIPALVVSFVVGVLYTVIRFFAWFIYSEIEINKTDGSILQRHKFMSKTRRVVEIDKHFNFEKFEFDKQSRSEQTKYLLKYKTFDLFVIKNEEHKSFIESRIKKLKFNH